MTSLRFQNITVKSLIPLGFLVLSRAWCFAASRRPWIMSATEPPDTIQDHLLAFLKPRSSSCLLYTSDAADDM
eukprot:11682961-Prorocentrum_lima.AAC.1